MGVLAPGSVHTSPSTQPPIDTSIGARFCRVTFKLFKKKLQNPKNGPQGARERGGRINFFYY